MTVEYVSLIRHGETEWNTTGRWQGILPVPLNDIGREQARKLAAVLKQDTIQMIYTSNLSRAAETAQIIAEILDIPVTTDERLRELDIGVFQGLTVEEILQRHAQEYADFMAQPIAYVLPQGESRQQMGERVLAAWNEFVSQTDKQHIAIVSHGGAIKMLLSVLWPGQAEVFHTYDIPNTSITRLTCVDGIWQISDLANVAHLAHKDSSDKDAGVYF